MVRAEGLEPPRLSSREPKSRASTNSATPAKGRSNAPWRRSGRPQAAQSHGARRGLHSTAKSRGTTKMALQTRIAITSPSETAEETAIDLRQRLAEVLGDEAGAKGVRRLAMQPDRGARRFEGRHALGQQTQDEARQDIAGAGGGQRRRRIVGDGGAAIGGGNYRVGAFDQHNSAGQSGG